MIDVRPPGWVGCALAFLALCKVGFVSGFCVPCNVLKIAWDSMAKSWVFNNVRNAEIGLHTTDRACRSTGISIPSARYR